MTAAGAEPQDVAGRWTDRSVAVAGLGLSGASAARALLALGARVTVLDAADSESARAQAERLTADGAAVVLGTEPALPAGCDLVVTSPGWRPDQPLFAQAASAQVPIWGDVELAWRLRPTERPIPWLALTGTNGKTTAVRMLASMLQAAGLRAVAAGNVGTPLLEVVSGPYDVLALELSSFQLHWIRSMRAEAAAVLNVAPDHLDWHGSMQAYADAKGRVYEGCERACVYNAADPQTERLVRAADVAEGCRAVGFTLGAPGPGQLGVVEGLLVDRAFGPDHRTSAEELASVDDVQPTAPHTVANALAAAALARAHGIPAAAVRAGLRGFRPDPHRMAHVARVAEVDYVDDSKATNGHAAAASLTSYASVVWLAGGLAKGATFDDLVLRARDRLRGAVLIGKDRGLLAEALARHAPEVPVIEIVSTETGAMDLAVRAAAGLAAPGDTVLLAPACASMDMFAHYGERGDAFAAAVRGLRA